MKQLTRSLVFLAPVLVALGCSEVTNRNGSTGAPDGALMSAKPPMFAVREGSNYLRRLEGSTGVNPLLSKNGLGATVGTISRDLSAVGGTAASSPMLRAMVRGATGFANDRCILDRGLPLNDPTRVFLANFSVPFTTTGGRDTMGPNELDSILRTAFERSFGYPIPASTLQTAKEMVAALRAQMSESSTDDKFEMCRHVMAFLYAANYYDTTRL